VRPTSSLPAGWLLVALAPLALAAVWARARPALVPGLLALVLAAIPLALLVRRLHTAGAQADARARDRAQEHQVLAQLGREALAATEEQTLLRVAIGALDTILDVDCCAAFAFDDTGVLRLTAGAGWAADAPAVEASTGPDTEAGWVLRHDGPVVVEDYTDEARFARSPVLRERGAAAGMSVAFRGAHRAYGVLGVHTVDHRRFSEHDAAFLQSVAHILGSAVERLESERVTRHAALHDALTGLPNRTLFNDRLAHALLRSRRDRTTVAVVLLDLDNFKVVNDSLGHEAGDALLAALAPRLTTTVRDSDTVARLGGDEFVVLLDGVKDDADVRVLTERVMAAWERPLMTEHGEVWASASVGVSVCAHGRRSATELLREADVAMYRAKASGRGRCSYFDGDMRRETIRRLHLEADLRRALDEGELDLAFQPIVRVCDRRVVGLEALTRWTSAVHGPVSPAEFIPLAEQTGLVDRIGALALDRACAHLASWRATIPAADDLSVSVNASAVELADPTYVTRVADALERHGVPAGALALELTETALLDERGEAPRTIAALHDLGVRVVLDDFGTGYSSLGYLTRVAVSQIKVDRTFVSGPGADGGSAILSAVASMARALGLSVVAEGVETEEQLARVENEGCEFAQGYLFSRPVPARDVPAALTGGVTVGPGQRAR
jgi:diguanylate cyclase (GGDEF)-like protein